MQRSEGCARQTERQWDARIKTAQNRRGRGRKTSVICNLLMFNGCSWIKNFQLLSARWKWRKEGGRDRRGGEGGGGASEQHIYIYISTLHLIIRGKTPLCLKILWRRAWITYFLALQTWHKRFHPFVCFSWCVFEFVTTACGLWGVMVPVEDAGL